MELFCIRSVSGIRGAAIWLISVCALATAAHATTLIVSNTNDSGPGSLRQALAIANDGDTIDATGISGAISLISGELRVNKSVTINGAGADVLAVDGNAAGRVFFITLGETVTISGFTIRNGHAGNPGGGIDNEDGSTVTITNFTISGNVAGLGGCTCNRTVAARRLSPTVLSAATRLAPVAASSTSGCLRSPAARLVITQLHSAVASLTTKHFRSATRS